MSEHIPYTHASVSLDEHGTQLNVSFHTPEVSVAVLGAQRERPFLSLSTAEATVTITTTGAGPVTEQDVTLARKIADAAARYLADCERLHTERRAASAASDVDRHGEAA
ncbi:MULTISPECIES: hypothetical protein [Streptosporangium]|uniref:DUF1876 domain-containing protein n=1 Tax=Streptosporangium brasiliense TaxID=47480 RepID=A0ABT9R2B5_9ACTN|nr:hypothetical protein [Streptosporangium brasiliense]MDP9863370.1 hypothetical protein [Streptosporangium brasiliense]